MELLLWRHADAVYSDNDIKRQLTEKGRLQAEKMGKWILKHFPKNYVLWVSEATRTQETASMLKHQMLIKPELNPTANTADIAKLILKNIFKKNMIVVGHQPWMGELTNYLLYMDKKQLNTPSLRPLKKGSIYWLDIKISDEKQLYSKIKAVLTPNLLD